MGSNCSRIEIIPIYSLVKTKNGNFIYEQQIDEFKHLYNILYINRYKVNINEKLYIFSGLVDIIYGLYSRLNNLNLNNYYIKCNYDGSYLLYKRENMNEIENYVLYFNIIEENLIIINLFNCLMKTMTNNTLDNSNFIKLNEKYLINPIERKLYTDLISLYNNNMDDKEIIDLNYICRN